MIAEASRRKRNDNMVFSKCFVGTFGSKIVLECCFLLSFSFFQVEGTTTRRDIDITELEWGILKIAASKIWEYDEDSRFLYSQRRKTSQLQIS